MEKTFDIRIEKDYGLLKSLNAGDFCNLYGKMYVMRDAAHKKIKELLEAGEDVPVNFKNSVIYYMGPTPSRPGKIIGSCGPTSSYRMDLYFEKSLELGIAATIGKGERSSFVTELIRKYKAPYLITIGGAGSYLAECVLSSKTILFEELGPEAIMEISVEKFPAVVGIDAGGNSILGK
jgi:fumarate hydratase subunit beta